MSLQEQFPWTKRPLIINAPMASTASPQLACAVTNASGFGFIGGLGPIENLRTQLSTAASALSRTADGFLPLGIGLLTFTVQSSLPAVVDLLREFSPRAVWLFAAHGNADYGEWAAAIRAKCAPGTMVWIQTGSVADAVEIAGLARPDVMCVQGADAGGHGLEAGAGVVALLPEVADALREAGFGAIQLVAAGGIADGRGVAAALALGAQGVVMGTRFLAASETNVHAGWRKAVLATSDGGQRTVRSKLFDEMRGPNQWPIAYDGRSIRNESWKEFAQGIGLEELRTKFAAALKGEDAGFAADGSGRATMWSGTAVGLVKAEQPAGEIVEEVRTGAIAALEAAKSRL